MFNVQIFWGGGGGGVVCLLLILPFLFVTRRSSTFKKNALLGIPWESSGRSSELPLQGAQVQPLVGELRTHMLCGVWPITI